MAQAWLAPLVIFMSVSLVIAGGFIYKIKKNQAQMNLQGEEIKMRRSSRLGIDPEK